MGRGRAGFTLLELMLAAMIGAMVVVACVGLFSAIDRQTMAGRERFGESLEVERTHATAERAIQLLVMSDTPAPAAPQGDRRGREGEETREEPSAAPAAPPEPPRFHLSFDAAHPMSIPVFDQRGNASEISPQRLEVALRAAPIFVPTSPREAEEDRERGRRRRGREAAEPAEAAGDLSLEDVTVAPGVRGVFELEYVARPATWSGRGGPEGTWSLWWRQLGVETDPGEMIWSEGTGPGRIRLASDLTRVHWQVFRGGEWRDEWKATWLDDLPAYVQLEIETVRGTNHQWLLEVGWTVGKEPGTEVRSASQNPQAGNQQQQQRPGGAQQPQPQPAPARPRGRVPVSGDHLRNQNPGQSGGR